MEYELVFDYLYHVDPGYHNSFHNTKAFGSLGFNDWENAKKLVSFLKPFMMPLQQYLRVLMLLSITIFVNF